MEQQQNIVFQLSKVITPETSREKGIENIRSVLSKIIDKCKVEDVVSGKYIVQEEDLEVKDLNLTENEFETLKDLGNKSFSKDAFQSLASNYEVCSKHEGYIFPAYTDSDDPYWLFYYPYKLSQLGNLQNGSMISGYWLNKTKNEHSYKLLLSNEETSIQSVSIVKCDGNEPTSHLFLRQKILLQQNAVVTVPLEFHDSIVSCLKTHGFM
jgi:hypothetical protein